MRLPRKLKKKLIKQYGRELVKRIISGHLFYRAKITSKLTENGWEDIYGSKTIFTIIK